MPESQTGLSTFRFRTFETPTRNNPVTKSETAHEPAQNIADLATFSISPVFQPKNRPTFYRHFYTIRNGGRSIDRQLCNCEICVAFRDNRRIEISFGSWQMSHCRFTSGFATSPIFHVVRNNVGRR